MAIEIYMRVIEKVTIGNAIDHLNLEAEIIHTNEATFRQYYKETIPFDVNLSVKKNIEAWLTKRKLEFDDYIEVKDLKRKTENKVRLEIKTINIDLDKIINTKKS